MAKRKVIASKPAEEKEPIPLKIKNKKYGSYFTKSELKPKKPIEDLSFDKSNGRLKVFKKSNGDWVELKGKEKQKALEIKEVREAYFNKLYDENKKELIYKKDLFQVNKKSMTFNNFKEKEKLEREFINKKKKYPDTIYIVDSFFSCACSNQITEHHVRNRKENGFKYRGWNDLINQMLEFHNKHYPNHEPLNLVIYKVHTIDSELGTMQRKKEITESRKVMKKPLINGDVVEI